MPDPSAPASERNPPRARTIARIPPFYNISGGTGALPFPGTKVPP
ncbi:hypothetical protein B4135_0523 [Caldibacillus debilis]|uniref:Uncharacterized protein n=1 Tax=Caldibacillus debilis TaxID=301148 RepID=A0A150M9L4_9BACI|nr:hypothetical protein B4135_0523 [Caldibacillus debilis]